MGEFEKELRKISKALTELARKLDQIRTKAVRGTRPAAKAAKKPTSHAAGRAVAGRALG